MKLYTDGACSPNPGLGGWAAIFYNNKNVLEQYYGYLENTTNNVMEITAVIKGLQQIRRYTKSIEIVTDSMYVINTMTQGWKRNKNIELWNQLDAELNNFTYVRWTWVKGHCRDPFNIKCDELAVKARTDKITTDADGGTMPITNSIGEPTIYDSNTTTDLFYVPDKMSNQVVGNVLNVEP